MSLGCWILECKRATGIDGVGDGRTSTDDDDAAPSSTLAMPARAVGAVSSSRLLETTSEGVLVRVVLRPAALLLRSELAWWFLAGAGVDEVGFALDLLLCLLPRCRSVFLWIDVAVDLSLLAARDDASVASMACSRAGR